MRDDLHRGAPVAPHWRTVIKRCASDADWETEGRRAFDRAISKDGNDLLSGGVVRHLRRRVADGVPPIPGVSPDRWVGRALTSVERDMTRSVMRAMSEGTAHAGTVHGAALGALSEHVRGVGLQVSGHVHSKDPGSHAEFMGRFRSSASGASIGRVARARADGERLGLRRSRGSVDLDKDLGA